MASVNAVTALLNVGGAGYIEIRTGAQPADVSVAATGIVLATLPLSATAFGAATDGTGKATAAANPITEDSSADTTGTATWFRAYSGAGVAVIDGNAGLAADTPALVLNNVDLTLNDTVNISPWNFEQSET